MGRNESKRYTLLRKLLKAIGLSAERIDELITIIQSWLAADQELPAEPEFPYQLRDRFVDGVFAAARLPLVHVPVSHSYPTKKLRAFLQQKAGLENSDAPSAVEEIEREETAVPNCPQCKAPMILRTAQRGTNKGNQFWGCAQYPHCRGIRQVDGTGQA